jgi:hypothetical protein
MRPLDLTAGDTVELRVLGKSEVPTLRWRAVAMATGSNVAIAGDTSRRVLISRLESPLENPEDRYGPGEMGWQHHAATPLVHIEKIGESELRRRATPRRISPWSAQASSARASSVYG